jgi:hypothetical protein
MCAPGRSKWKPFLSLEDQYLFMTTEQSNDEKVHGCLVFIFAPKWGH